jgi:hypothetical protein
MMGLPMGAQTAPRKKAVETPLPRAGNPCRLMTEKDPASLKLRRTGPASLQRAMPDKPLFAFRASGFPSSVAGYCGGRALKLRRDKCRGKHVMCNDQNVIFHFSNKITI